MGGGVSVAHGAIRLLNDHQLHTVGVNIPLVAYAPPVAEAAT